MLMGGRCTIKGGVEEFLFGTLFNWPSLVAGFLLALPLGFIRRRRRLRLVASVALAAVPVAAFLILGMIDGCALRRGGPDCMWFAWGLVMLPMILIPWLLAIGAGGLAGRLARKRGQSP